MNGADQVTNFDWTTTKVLITGATGSFGQKFFEVLLREKNPEKLVAFSRDELKQHEMRHKYSDDEGSPIRYFLGDVRDRDRLYRAFRDIDLVIHAAALKQVPACEYNPFEAVQTNIIGAKNIIDAAIDCGVPRVVALSTDKAVNPVNLYGATKLVAEKLFTQGNSYAAGKTRFSCVRYGNVVGSRGSVIPLFKEQRKSGQITITDKRMTRFWITLEQGVRFVMRCAQQMHGGEVFIPRIPSMRVSDLASVVAPGCKVRFTGVRPGEKLHEVLVAEDEARRGLEFSDMYVIGPTFQTWDSKPWNDGTPLPEGFKYSSDNNPQWLSTSELRAIIESGDEPVATAVQTHP
jgi:UDP-N-acetylglucosamine 4,6-dehydratase